MQVGQITLSMNGVVQAIGNTGGLTTSGPAEQKQIREAWYALEPVAVQLIASVGGGWRKGGGIGEGFAELRALC